MKKLPFRRRAFAFIAIGIVFLSIALSGRLHHNTYLVIALCFFIVGVATLKRGGKTPV